MTLPPLRPPLRAAVIGTGGISRGMHLPALAALAPDVQIVAVVDLNPDAVAAAAAEFGATAYTDIAEMLAVEKPDLVTVGTPPGAHKDAVIAALDADAWVWCEKPPTLSLADYDEVAAHEGADGPYVSYVFQHRFGAAAERLRRHIAEGTLGRPTVAVCNTLWFRGPEYFDVPWRAKWATEGGGPTMGHGIHQMDLALSLLGQWSEVTAVMSTLARDTETEDVSMAIVVLEIIAGMYASALGRRTVRRDELTPQHPFSAAMHGGDAAGATAALAAGRISPRKDSAHV